MKVLVLTNPTHKDFVSKTIYPYNGYNDVRHDIHGFYEEEAYPFDGAGNYDIGVSFMYKHKVPKSELYRATWFNFHPAPLPEYKGRDLCYHAIMKGEKTFGATIHYMDENFDTGDIITVERFPIHDFYTAQNVSEMALAMSKDLFIQYLPAIIAGREFARTPNEGGTYYKKGQIVEELVQPPNEPFGQWVRAVTFKDFAPRLVIADKTYKIVRDE